MPASVIQPTASPLRVAARLVVWLSGFAALFLVFQLWGTAIHSERVQRSLEQRFDSLAAMVPDLVSSGVADSTADFQRGVSDLPDNPEMAPAPPSVHAPPVVAPVPSAAPRREPLAPEAVPLDPQLAEVISRVVTARAGQVIARLEFPSLGSSHMVMEGVEAELLRGGLGRYTSTSHLGGSGNVAIAGHRSTYGAPFADIDALRPGDAIVVDTPLGVALYEVMDPRVAFSLWIDRVREVGPGYVIVGPDDGFVLADVGDDRLTLTACHPRFSARERIIVAARMTTAPLAMLAPGFGAQEFDLAALQLDRSLHSEREPTAHSAEMSGNGPAAGRTAHATRPAQPPIAPVDDLREGLGGVSSELLPTVVWALVLLVAMTAASVIKLHRGAITATLIAVVPVAGILWMVFNHLDRLLPAY